MSTFPRKLFRFLASLKLAVTLMVVIILAVSTGTVLESWYNPEVARAYVYGAAWFNCWMALLAVNLFSVAAIRYPWKSHQTGFVITHAGMIMVLMGGLIDRRWGFEGYLSLHRGEPATSVLQMHESEVVINKAGSTEALVTPFNLRYFPAAWNKPFVENDFFFGWNPSFDAKLPVSNYRLSVESTVPVSVETDAEEFASGAPALRWVFDVPNKMGRLEGWVFLNETSSPGPATIAFKRGMPPVILSRERTFQFAKNPDKFPTRVFAGKPTEAKSKLVMEGETPFLELSLQGKSYRFDVNKILNQETPLEGLNDYKLAVKSYFNNLTISDEEGVVNKPGAAENPAVLFELIGPPVDSVPPSEAEDAHAKKMSMEELARLNSITFYLGDDGKIRYHIKTRKEGERIALAEEGKGFRGFWGDEGKISWAKLVPAARPAYRWKQRSDMLPNSMEAKNRTQGLRCKLYTSEGKLFDDFIVGPDESEVKRATTKIGNDVYELSYRAQQLQLPYSVRLMKFYAREQEGMAGSGQFEAFESTLSFNDQADHLVLRQNSEYLNNAELRDYLKDGKLTGSIIEQTDSGVTIEFGDRRQLIVPSAEIQTVEHNTSKIEMNQPTTFPRTKLGPFLGTTYKFSQASHDFKNDPDFSAVQVLWDPGWLPKWIGCLGIISGIFTMFYLKPYFRGRQEYLKAEAARKAAESESSLEIARQPVSATRSGVGMGKES